MVKSWATEDWLLWNRELYPKPYTDLIGNLCEVRVRI